MTYQCHDTKEKIMEVARVLFSDHGFEGTSVRDIAKAADVNVASVNYHFSNKENLLTEIMRSGYEECSHTVKSIYERNNSLEETLVELFQYFTERSHNLVSMFKIKLSTQHSHHFVAEGSKDQLLGPPGGVVIAAAIRNELGPDVTEEDVVWALRCLFTHVVHQSLMYNCCMKQGTSFQFTDTDIEKSIRRLTRIVLQDLRKK